MSNKTTVILVAGHGGLINGEYQTSGKRSPIWDDGTILYEGEFNRQIKSRLMEMFQEHNIPYVDLVPEHLDISLEERLDRAKIFYKTNRNCIFIEIHANGYNKPTATGIEVFISTNASNTSKWIADCFKTTYPFTDLPFRGVKVKEFFLIHNVPMPSVLIENPFMTTEQECKKYLMSRQGREYLAQWHFNAIIKALNRIES